MFCCFIQQMDVNTCCKTCEYSALCAMKHIKKLANQQKVAICFGMNELLPLSLHSLITRSESLA